VSRLCRSFLTSLDGELIWRDLLNHFENDAEHKFFRLNVEFDRPEPRLDDVTAMDRLSKDVNAYKDDQKLDDIKMALLTSCFFFELRRPPRFDASGFYVCQGDIRVRGDYFKLLGALRGISNAPVEFTKDDVSLGQIDLSGDVCSHCYRFGKKVCFFVRHVSESITISMNMDQYKRPISGFPQTTEWFAIQQHLQSPFYSAATLSSTKRTCPCQATDSTSKRRQSGNTTSSTKRTKTSSKTWKVKSLV